ncbi:hypothetical protein XA39_00200 [Acinetobacter tandoii]|nr:hypothetical protein XA39_00200 [Acinetobacter tandoii]
MIFPKDSRYEKNYFHHTLENADVYAKNTAKYECYRHNLRSFFDSNGHLMAVYFVHHGGIASAAVSRRVYVRIALKLNQECLDV